MNPLFLVLFLPVVGLIAFASYRIGCKRTKNYYETEIRDKFVEALAAGLMEQKNGTS